MSYQVFARKYRPKTFDDVLGQDHVVQTLKNAIEQNRLAHAYLFVGPRGTGKTSTARIFAKALNCSGGPSTTFDPDEPICQEIAEGRSLDVLEIDGASNRGIDSIRSLRDDALYAPTKGQFRIIYIDEVHMLTKEAFNALLKILEEPPAHVKFIFATTEPHKILPTILSRCQRFDLHPIPTNIIADHLMHIATAEGVRLSPSAAFIVAKLADGGMRDAQSMLDQLVSFCGKSIEEKQVIDIFGITSRDTVGSALSLILRQRLPELLQLVSKLAESGKDMGQFLSELINAVRELLVAKVVPTTEFNAIPSASGEELRGLLKKVQTDKILRLTEILAETEERMRWATNKRLYLEMGFIKAIQSLSEASISDIILALNGAPAETLRPITPEPAEIGTPLPESSPHPSVVEASPRDTTAPAPVIETDQDHFDPIPEFPNNRPSEPVEEIPEQIDSANDETGDLEQAEPEFIDPEPVIIEEPDVDDVGRPEIQQKIPRELPSTLLPTENNTLTPANPVGAETEESDLPDFLEPDPEAGLPEERRTRNFLDHLFGEPEPVDRPTDKSPVNVEVKDEDVAIRELNSDDWAQALDYVAGRHPLQASFLNAAHFVGHQGTLVHIAFHPTDIQGINLLSSDHIKSLFEEYLTQRAGVNVTISVKQDATVPEPIQEELPPPAPEPPSAPKPAVKETKTAPAEPTPEKEVDKTEDHYDKDNGFYSDPLIDQALKLFHARLIS